MSSALNSQRPAWAGPLPLAAAAGAVLTSAYLLAANPLLAAGVVAGSAVIFVSMNWPLTVVAAMLAIGPLNLSGLSGGRRELLVGLGGLDMNGIRLLGIAAGLGMVILTRRDLLGRLLEREVRWYALFLVWGAASLLQSPDPLEGTRLLLKIAYPLLFFLVISAPEHTGREARRLGDWALWGATIILLVNPIFVVNGGWVVENGSVRVGGVGTHFNPFSFYLLSIMLLCVARIRERREARYIWLAGLAVVWMALTVARITMLATMVAISVVAFYTSFVNRDRRTLLVILALGGAVAALALEPVLLRTFGYVPSIGQFFSLITNPAALYASINWQGREVLWEILAFHFQQSPWIGSGLGSSSTFLWRTLGPDIAHNEYLRLAVDVGLVGCALYLAAILSWIAAVVRAVRARSPGTEEFTVPALALIAAWGVIAITDNAFDYYNDFTQYIGFLVASCVVITRGPERPGEDPEPEVVFSSPANALGSS